MTDIALLTAGLACFALGMALELVLGVKVRAWRALPYLAALAGSGLLLVLGVRVTLGTGAAKGLHLLGLGQATLRLDPLAGMFLTLLFGLGVPVSACFAAWVRSAGTEHHRGTAIGYLLVLGSVAVVLVAANAFVFLFAWELLTVAFYVLTAATRSGADQPRAAWATAGFGKLSGAALLVGFLLLAGRSGSLTIAAWHAVGPGPMSDVAWAMVVVGFAAKLGAVPFHVWLPVGYPAAPGPARAAMAGIGANVGVYGLWRFLGVLARPPVGLVVAVLLAGGVTALLGISFAGVQGRLSRVVAYSSVENAGLILTAYGVALAGALTGSEAVEALGLLAATLQTITHAVAKSALFCSLASMQAAAGTDDLEVLRGVGRRLKWSGAAFAAGALTLAGLPPTIGFVSEWFVLEALMQQFRLPGLAVRLALAGAGALVALTTGLAALAFLRVLGFAVLGRGPGNDPWRGAETGVLGKAGLTLLGATCLGLAAASPWEVRYIALGLGPLVAKKTVLGALRSPWVLQPVFQGFSVLSPSWLWVAMPLAVLVVLLATAVLSRGRLLRVRRAPAWHSATSGVSGPSDYSAFGFANPLRHVLANVLGTRRSTGPVEGTGAGLSDEAVDLETVTGVSEPVGAYFYRPGRTFALRVSGWAKRMQSGRLNAYVAYMFLALLAVLALVAALR